MAIATELTRLINSKASLKNSIENKGVPVPSSATLDTYYSYVDQIEQGGGGCDCLSPYIDRSITSVEIPTDITEIGCGAFSYCTYLTSVTISDNITTIGGNAFSSCDRLTSIGLKGSGASIEIPTSVTSIGDYAFQGCTNLATIDLPDSITRIDSGAFSYCNSLTSITIGTGITKIEHTAFYVCTGLTSITINATTPPTLDATNAFDSTNNCPIYVPSESVEAYKTASKWSNLANRIFAIP